MDTITKNQRSANMAQIRSKNTRPELTVRRALYARGIRYRIHNARLPGRPDVSIMKYRLLIDIRGCFWHGHQGCKFSTRPATNPDYWVPKIQRNIDRDTRNTDLWNARGYSVFVVWECETKKPSGLESQIDLIESHVRKFTSTNVSSYATP